MFFHIFRHINTHHILVVIKQKFSQGPCELGLSNSRRAHENKRTDRPVGVLQAGTAAAHGGGHPAGGCHVDRHRFLDKEWQPPFEDGLFRRAVGERGERPLHDPIRRAIHSYDEALAARPDSLEARWKLLRALHFAGDFVLEDRGERRRIFDRGRQVSEQGLELLAEARDATGLLIVTEVMEPELVPLISTYADILQIGARNMQNYALLEAAGRA